MGTRLDPVPGLPGGELLIWGVLMNACILTRALFKQELQYYIIDLTDAPWTGGVIVFGISIYYVWGHYLLVLFSFWSWLMLNWHNYCCHVAVTLRPHLVSLGALALPPPPALDEEAPANYFNLDPGTSPAVMNIALPPPPGINPPPPGKIVDH